MRTDAEFVDRILDAAAACLQDAPPTSRLHAVIAERAGVSRPTVYKYVGDQDAIIRALVEREAFRYVGALLPHFARRLPLREHFIELTVFSVQYFRDNPLYQAARKHAPELMARGLTVDLGPLLRKGLEVVAPLLRESLPQTARSQQHVELLLEWGVRISLSLLTTPSPLSPLDTPESIRAHVQALFDIAAMPALR